MSTKLISYENLSAYDSLIKAWVDGSSATSQSNVIFRTVLYDNDNIYFYHKANAVKGTDTPDVTVPLAGSDVTKALAEISAIVTALGGEMAATAPYTVTFPNLTTEAKSTLVAAINEVDAHADANATAIGILNGNDTTTGSVAKSIKDAIAALDATLAAVAKSGDADDVAYDNTTSGLAATDVQGALDELAEASAEGVESKTVYITETPGSTGDLYSKRYGIYQGATGSAASPVAGEKLADIDIPKDMVVVSGSVETVTTPDVPYEGAQVGDKYIDLVIANATSDHIYIPANSLVDIYTAEQGASQIQLVIDSSNEISATIVAGSVTATELASNAVVTAKIQDSAVTTAKIADDAVTADKVAIAAHSESANQTGRTDGLSVTVTTTDGQVSGVTASIAAGTYYDTTNYVLAQASDINALFNANN